MQSELIVHALTKIYKSPWSLFKRPEKPFVAVDGISFSLQKGEILGLLGPNGAGKSTTMQMLLGTLTQTNGSISYFGKDFSSHRTEILQHVGYASAYSRLPGRLTVKENLLIYATLYGLSKNVAYDRMYELLHYFNATHLMNKQAGELSAGQATRIMLIKTFLANPRIVLLDEPTASLDPDVAYSVRHFLLEQKKKTNVSMILASHDMDEVAEVCDRVLVLKEGVIIAVDTPSHLASTVKTARVIVTIMNGLEQALAYAKEQSYLYTMQDHSLEIHLEEKNISTLLTELGKRSVTYSHISIEKPTLEDYFLSIAKGS
jgi:ABC-2 type transport system ATP-binding protein